MRPTVEEYAAAIWAYGTRTTNSGSVSMPVSKADFYADSIWSAQVRTLSSGQTINIIGSGGSGAGGSASVKWVGLGATTGGVGAAGRSTVSVVTEQQPQQEPTRAAKGFNCMIGENRVRVYWQMVKGAYLPVITVCNQRSRRSR